jgi:hypothetical protein
MAFIIALVRLGFDALDARPAGWKRHASRLEDEEIRG